MTPRFDLAHPVHPGLQLVGVVLGTRMAWFWRVGSRLVPVPIGGVGEG